MPLFVNTSSVRPNRLTDEKNEKYHSDYGRWTLNSLNHPLYRRFVTKTLINWSFYKGREGQWIFEEDLEGFFLDESGDTKNRLKIAKNLIRPMVEQYEGNAIRLAFEAKARAVSDFAINRREYELGRIQFFEQAAKAVPSFDKAIRDKIPLGKTPAETKEIFENSWVNRNEKDINHLIAFIAEDVNMQEIKIQTTKHLAISGLGVYKGYPQNSVYMATAVDPLFFFWDLSARKPDLSDASFMGEWYYLDTPSIFERWQDMNKKDREAIEQYSRNQSIDVHRMVNEYYMVNGDKIPVYETYWKDCEEQEYGWVIDQFKYPYFAQINHEDSEYTDADLIDPPTKAHEKVLNGKKKAKIYVDVLRYCIFIPKEEVGNQDGNDIILEYGEVPYQETYSFSPSNVEFPYKCYAWSYDKGDVPSPLDDAIDPQRFINRILSVAESRINNSRGTGTVIAKDAVDPRDGEESVTRNVNQSKTIYLDTTRSGSVQNSVGSYGSNLGGDTTALFDIIQQMQNTIQDVTGVNSAMTGTQGGSDALVGVIQSQIQRGSLIQEPFYYALSSIMLQGYQHMGSVGKRVYYDNPRRLAMIVGDEGLQNITVSKDMLMEDFRTFIKRVESHEVAVNNGNATLWTLIQAGLIDKVRFANLFNRGDAEDIAAGLREYQAELLLASRENDDQQAQARLAEQEQMKQMAAKIEAMEAAAAGREDANKAADRELEYNKTYVKEAAKNDREKIKVGQEANELPEGMV